MPGAWDIRRFFAMACPPRVSVSVPEDTETAVFSNTVVQIRENRKGGFMISGAIRGNGAPVS